MTWLLAGPALALFLGLIALLPYGSLLTAARNTRRSNGRRSTRRTRRELHHVATFLRDAALVPLVLLVLMQGALFAVHTYVVPDNTTLSEIFGEYHPEVSLHAPDLEAWDEAIRADQRDRAYVAWQQAQGMIPSTPTAVSDLLVEHWPLHLIFFALPFAFLTWFFRRRYFALARAYHLGVAQRSKRYALYLATSF
jgi:hypothetical protein